MDFPIAAGNDYANDDAVPRLNAGDCSNGFLSTYSIPIILVDGSDTSSSVVICLDVENVVLHRSLSLCLSQISLAGSEISLCTLS